MLRLASLMRCAITRRSPITLISSVAPPGPGRGSGARPAGSPVARRPGPRERPAAARPRHAHRRILGRDLGGAVVLGHGGAWRRPLLEDLGLDRAFAEIRELADVPAHGASVTWLRGAAM